MSVEQADEKKYENARVERFTGEVKKSFLAPLTLSCTNNILEQKETVMQLTASKDANN
jgi:hypothetical protein